MNKQLKMLILLCVMVFGAFQQAHAATIPVKDSSQMDLGAINSITARSVGGIPVGTVIAWPAANDPEDGDKWLECNGQSVSHAVYPELFAVVGGAVPDFRGLFLRGVGGNSAGLGQAQGDAIRNIYGEFDWNANSGGASGPFQLQKPSVGISNVDWSGPHVPDGVIFDASRVVPTAEENRPVNKSVRYLIRAKP